MSTSFFNEIFRNANGFVVINNSKAVYSNHNNYFLEYDLQGVSTEDFLSFFMDAENIEIASYPLTDTSAIVVVGEPTGSKEEGQLLYAMIKKVGMTADDDLISCIIGSSFGSIIAGTMSVFTNAPALSSSVDSTVNSISFSKLLFAAIIGSITITGVVGGIFFINDDDMNIENIVPSNNIVPLCMTVNMDDLSENMSSLNTFELITRGNGFYSEGSYNEALSYYQLAFVRDPSNIFALNGAGTTFEVLRMYDNAITCYADVLNIDAHNVNALIGKGNALVGLNTYDDALLHYNRALDLSPNNVNALIGKGNALVGLNTYDDALLHYNRALDLSPNNVNALIGKGNALVGLNTYDDALLHYNRALDLSPNNVNALIGKIKSLVGLGDFVTANNLLSEILETYPNNIDAIEIKNKLNS